MTATPNDECVALAQPVEIANGDVRVPDDVQRASRQIRERWRLDAAMALGEYLG
jgi:hypothetical protein